MQTLNEQVTALSLSREATAHWIDFLTRAMAMLTSAEGQLRSDWPAFLEKINKRKKKASKIHIPEEPDITVEIGHALRRAICALSLEDPWVVVAVSAEDPRESAHRAGKYSERIDLYVRDPVRKLDLVFEAKRLMGSSATDYAGAEGVGRFTSADPYSYAPVAGMLGHVLDKDLVSWTAEVEAKIGKTLTIEATPGPAECCVRYSVESRAASALPNVLLIHRLVDYVAVCASGAAKP